MTNKVLAQLIVVAQLQVLQVLQVQKLWHWQTKRLMLGRCLLAMYYSFPAQLQ
jgi:hypothetical protein